MLRKSLKLLIYLPAGLLISVIGFAILIVEDSPLVEGAAPLNPDDVAKAREFVQGVRSAVQPGISTPASFVSNEEQLNSVIKLGARLIPGFRGRLQTTDTDVEGVASIPVPYTQKWINLRATAPEFEGTFGFSSVHLGPIGVPPEFALGFGRTAANVMIGQNFGDTVLAAASSMRMRLF